LSSVKPEVATRLGSLLLVIWLVIGAVAAGQRHWPDDQICDGRG
jgi:hypothetical protein